MILFSAKANDSTERVAFKVNIHELSLVSPSTDFVTMDTLLSLYVLSFPYLKKMTLTAQNLQV